MDIALTPDLEALIREEVESGRYSSPADLIREALRIFRGHSRPPRPSGIGEHEEALPQLMDRDAEAPPGLRELVRRGTARRIVHNDPSQYRTYERALATTTAQELLDWDRASVCPGLGP